MQLSVADRGGSVIIDEIDRPILAGPRLERVRHLSGNPKRALSGGPALDREPLLEPLRRVLVPLAPSLPPVRHAGTLGCGRYGFNRLHLRRASQADRLPGETPRRRHIFTRPRHDLDATLAERRPQVVSTIGRLETLAVRRSRVLLAGDLRTHPLPPALVGTGLAGRGVDDGSGRGSSGIRPRVIPRHGHRPSGVDAVTSTLPCQESDGSDDEQGGEASRSDHVYLLLSHPQALTAR